MASSPTGTQHELTHADQVAVVTEMGATLRTYEVGGRPVIAGFPATHRPDGGRGQVLAPWPNRIRDGRYSFGGEEHQLGLTEVPKRNAIHGLVRWTGWQLAERGADRVSLTTTVWPQTGYPFLVRLRATYRLGDGGLDVALHARNDGDRAAPYGVGHHPYLTVGTAVDAAVLTLPAGQRLVADDRGIPVAAEAVAGTAYDFRTSRTIGDLVIDDAYVGLGRGSDGRVRVTLENSSGHGLEMWADEAASCLQVFTGDTLPDPALRRQSLAVEPMSCPAGAFDTGADLVTLQPGAEHELRWGVHSW